MNKIKYLTAAVLFGLGLGGTAMAADFSNGLTVTGDVHANSSYQYRGQEFSNGDPSIGARVTASHTSGLYGTIQTDTIKLTEGSSRNQLQNALTVGYNHTLPYDVTIGGGLTRNFFTGRDHVSDLSFSEAFLNADWKGVHAKVSTVVESADLALPGFYKGDTYAELGYTYHIDKFSLGGDIGYSWYDSHHIGAKDNLSVAQVRVGYAVNDRVDVALTHQFAGDDAYDSAISGRHKTSLSLAYKF